MSETKTPLQEGIDRWKRDEINRWVPVGEMLPRKGTRVLVWVGFYALALFEVDESWDVYSVDQRLLAKPLVVTHWRSLPRSP